MSEPSFSGFLVLAFRVSIEFPFAWSLMRGQNWLSRNAIVTTPRIDLPTSSPIGNGQGAGSPEGKIRRLDSAEDQTDRLAGRTVHALTRNSRKKARPSELHDAECDGVRIRTETLLAVAIRSSVVCTCGPRESWTLARLVLAGGSAA